jgi:hypothetical protein
MMTIGDQLTHDPGFTQREFKQTRGAFAIAAPHRGHAIKGVRDLPHPVRKGGLRFVVPRVAVTAADRDISCAQPIDRFQRAGQFRRQRYSLDIRGVGQELPNDLRFRFANEVHALRAMFLGRDEWPFDVRAAELRNERSRTFDRVHDPRDLFERRAHGGKKQRGRAAAGVVIANRTKGVRGAFHRVPADRAVHMQIDETGRKEVPREVDYLFTGDRNLAPQRDDLSRLHAERKPVGDPLGKNQPATGKDHWREHHCVYFGGSPSSSCNDSGVRCRDRRRCFFRRGHGAPDQTATPRCAYLDYRKSDCL